jgi:uncharacterized protein (DUF1330 family)
MTAYVVAQLAFTRVEAYRRYQARFMDVFRAFDGRLLAAEEQVAVLEGAWPRDKVVLMSFPDEAAYRRFADSAAYQEIARDRKQGADAVVLLVRGLAPAG